MHGAAESCSAGHGHVPWRPVLLRCDEPPGCVNRYGSQVDGRVRVWEMYVFEKRGVPPVRHVAAGNREKRVQGMHET